MKLIWFCPHKQEKSGIFANDDTRYDLSSPCRDSMRTGTQEERSHEKNR